MPTQPTECPSIMTSEGEASEAGDKDQYYMKQALRVAEAALEIGEVPVGCVLVFPSPQGRVIVAHGANQVNATRDPTRHAELVAIDRALTLGASSDQLRLPPRVLLRPSRSQSTALSNDSNEEDCHNDINGSDQAPPPSPLRETTAAATAEPTPQQRVLEEYRRRDARWTNAPGDLSHWTNNFGWGSGHTLTVDDVSRCTLYVTCEPCVMCAAALARIQIRRVVYGCRNDRFGGTGSLLQLHLPNGGGSAGRGFEATGGVENEAAVALLRSFYHRENCYAPEDKRKRKPGTAPAAAGPKVED